MLFKKREEVKHTLEVKPLNYWEESSYMIIPIINNDLTKDVIIDRLSSIEGLYIKGVAEPSDDRPGRVVFSYESNNYDFNYYIDSFDLPDMYFYQNGEFNDEEIRELKKCKEAVIIFMDFTEQYKKEYKIELLVSSKIVPKLYGIIDESAEKLMHPKYVNMLVSSKFLPSDDCLYSVQAIVDKESVWLHTHGLLRCGITELEILDSNKKNYDNHYNVITTLVTHLMDNEQKEDNIYNIGFLSDGTPLKVTLKIWTEALSIYDGIDLGGVTDRQQEHNTNRSVLFVYKNSVDEKNNIISKMNVFDDVWGEEPVFFITTISTNRMKEVARERFSYVRKALEDKENTVIIKIGLETDSKTGNYEHMWFELLEINGDTFKAKLMSEPYEVSSIHEGDINTYKIDEITDWIIYTNDRSINPEKAYLLD